MEEDRGKAKAVGWVAATVVHREEAMAAGVLKVEVAAAEVVAAAAEAAAEEAVMATVEAVVASREPATVEEAKEACWEARAPRPR